MTHPDILTSITALGDDVIVKTLILACVIGAACGAWLGHLSQAQVIATRPASISEKRVRELEKPRRLSREEMISHANEWIEKSRKPGFDPGSPFSDLLADWSIEDIRKALDASLKDPDCVLGDNSLAVDTLFAELMKRDIELAVRWFDGISIDAMRRRMALSVSHRWPAEHAARGLDFVLSHRDLFGTASPWSILVKNMEAQAKQGPAALGDLLKRFSAEKLDLGFGNNVTLPADFDFAKFVTTEGFQIQKNTPLMAVMLSGWIDRDKEAAFDWFQANGNLEKLPEMISRDPAKRAGQFEWLGAKLSSLEGDQAARLFDAMSVRLNSDPRAAAALAKGIQDPQLREKAIFISARLVFIGDLKFALTELEGISDPGRRVDFLASIPTSPPAQVFFGRRPVSEDDLALLRGKLAEWGANESQTESILKKVKP